MSVVAQLKPGHTRNMALGCSTTTPTGYARPRPSPGWRRRRAQRHFVFCVDCYRKRKRPATGLNVFDFDNQITTERRQFLLARATSRDYLHVRGDRRSAAAAAAASAPSRLRKGCTAGATGGFGGFAARTCASFREHECACGACDTRASRVSRR